MHGADRLVVGIEQIQPRFIARSPTRVAGQHELLEEPAGVRQMPFAGAGIGHRLDLQVFGGQPGAQVEGALAHAAKARGHADQFNRRYRHRHRSPSRDVAATAERKPDGAARKGARYMREACRPTRSLFVTRDRRQCSGIHRDPDAWRPHRTSQKEKPGPAGLLPGSFNRRVQSP
jgi:hypothetical protein